MNNGDCESREFEVKVGVHQGSVLSLLLFIIVLEALSKEFRKGLPWELLYADDLALIAESEKKLAVLIFVNIREFLKILIFVICAY